MICRKSIWSLFFFVLLTCQNQNHGISLKKSYAKIIFALSAKNSECNSSIGIPYIPKKSTEKSVNDCMMAIIDASCPFTSLPLLCVEIYTKKVPGTATAEGSTDVLKL